MLYSKLIGTALINNLLFKVIFYKTFRLYKINNRNTNAKHCKVDFHYKEQFKEKKTPRGIRSHLA